MKAVRPRAVHYRNSNTLICDYSPKNLKYRKGKPLMSWQPFFDLRSTPLSQLQSVDTHRNIEIKCYWQFRRYDDNWKSFLLSVSRTITRTHPNLQNFDSTVNLPDRASSEMKRAAPKTTSENPSENSGKSKKIPDKFFGVLRWIAIILKMVRSILIIFKFEEMNFICNFYELSFTCMDVKIRTLIHT